MDILRSTVYLISYHILSVSSEYLLCFYAAIITKNDNTTAIKKVDRRDTEICNLLFHQTALDTAIGETSLEKIVMKMCYIE